MQGTGVLMTVREMKDIMAWDEELGLRELRAKVNGKFGIDEKPPPNRFSISAEYCVGAHSVEIVRQYLESGILSDLVTNGLRKNNRCWFGDDAFRFETLVAYVMTLGCELPPIIADGLEKSVHPAYIEHMKKIGPEHCRSDYAMAQLRKAIYSYKPGTPYKFGNKPYLEASAEAFTPPEGLEGIAKREIVDLGPYKIWKVEIPPLPMMPQIITPPTDDELCLEHMPIHPAEVCAHCGKKEAKEGKDLSICARCHDRKYCSRDCQKKHWKLHKIICTIPAERMKIIMEGVPASLKADHEAGMEGAMAFIQPDRQLWKTPD